MQIGTGVAIDAADDILVTGGFYGGIDFPGATPGHVDTLFRPVWDRGDKGPMDVFVAKLDPMGDHVWSKRFGSTGSADDYAMGRAVAVDPGGNVVLGGVLTSPTDLSGVDAGPVLGGNGVRPFVAKYGPGGDYLWARAFASPLGREAELNDLALDPAGDVYAGGHFFGALDPTGEGDAGAGFLSGPGDQATGWLVRLAPDGRFVWSVALPGAGNTSVRAVAAGGRGSVAAAGYSGYWDGDASPDYNTFGTLVSKRHAATGAEAWSLIVRHGAQSQVALAFDLDDDLFLASASSGTVVFRDGLEAGGGGSATGTLVAKLGTSGATLWAHEFSPVDGGGMNSGAACAVDRCGTEIFLGGYLAGGAALPGAGGAGEIVLSRHAPGGAMYLARFTE
jgi:hypothetical protein